MPSNLWIDKIDDYYNLRQIDIESWNNCMSFDIDDVDEKIDTYNEVMKKNKYNARKLDRVAFFSANWFVPGRCDLNIWFNTKHLCFQNTYTCWKYFIDGKKYWSNLNRLTFKGDSGIDFTGQWSSQDNIQLNIQVLKVTHMRKMNNGFDFGNILDHRDFMHSLNLYDSLRNATIHFMDKK